MNFILMQFDYLPVVIRTDDNASYYNVLRLADAGQIAHFVVYIAQNLINSLAIMLAGAKGENVVDDYFEWGMRELEKQIRVS